LLEAVKSSRVPATHPDLPFEWSGQRGMLQIRAVPLPTAEPSGFLVIFERRVAEPGHATTPEAPLSGGADEAQTRIRELDAQVAFLREELHRLRNEQVCAGEELQAANEEIQSTNEELQSTNEELESAKEELQSTNEELTSINAGMADKLSVLAAENDEVCAMFSAMGIPVVLLSPELRIRRFSQAAAPLLNVIEGDIGRPFSHVRPTLDLPDIERVCGEVLDSRVSHTFESRSASGEWYSVTVRAFPSVPVASVSPGILVMFVGATGVRLSPGDARWFSHVTRDSNEVVTLIDPGGRFMTWSERAERLYGYPESEALRLSINDILPAQYHADMHAMLTAARQRQLCLPERQARKVKSGWVRDVVVRLTAMFDQRGDLYAFALTDTPVERWSESAEKWWGISDILDTVNESLVLMDTKGKILWWGTSAEQMFGFSAAEMLGQSAGKYWQEPLLETLEKYTDVSGTPALFLSFSTTRKTLREGDIATEGFCFPMTRDHQVIFLALWERKR
jgi:two-component system CheB/CheR fusion protein